MKLIYRYILPIIAIAALSSCEHKELCYEHFASLHITFDWQNAPEANPTSMRVYLYPADDASNYEIVDLPKEGGYINDIAPGEYKLLCFNNTETNIERYIGSFVRQSLTTSLTGLFEPAGISTYSSIPRPADTDDEDVHLEPDIVWGCTETIVTITDSGVTYHTVADDDRSTTGTHTHVTEREIILYPRELTSTYTCEIRNVKNLNSNVVMMTASLSGLAEGMNLSTGDPTGNDVTVPFLAGADGDSSIVGIFENFGSTYNSPNKLALYVWMTDGKVYAYGIENADKFDVTDQVRNAPDPHHVHIIIDGLELVGGTDAGYVPEVDDWGIGDNQDIVI
jgi:hypothetical protein